MVKSNDSSDRDRENGKTESNSAQQTRNQSEKGSDEETDHEPGMRVGEDYQAVIPELASDKEKSLKADCRPEPLQVWAPSQVLTEMKLEEYLQAAKDKHGYNTEQALGMLYWHKHNVDKSLEDLSNFTPLPDEWSMEDKVIFEHSFNSHGKHFSKIRSQLPDKSIGSLVRYYYSWKKTRNRTSLMDRQARRTQKDNSGFGMVFSDPESDGGDDTSDSDFDPESKGRYSNGKKSNSVNQTIMVPNADVKPMHTTQPVLVSCSNCNITGQQIHATPKGQLCTSCYEYWKRTGFLQHKLVAAIEGGNIHQLYKGPQAKLKKKPPKGIKLTQDSLIDVSQTHGDNHVRQLEAELINLRRQIQTNKQNNSQEKQRSLGPVEKCRPPDMSQKVNARWTNEELLIAVQCVRKYGKDFQAMAEVLGNKNISQCRNFFVNYRRRFNLLDVLEEYEKENSITHDRNAHREWEEMQMAAMAESEAACYPPGIPPSSVGSPFPQQGQPPPLYRPLIPASPRPLITQPVQIPRAPIGSSVQGPPPLSNQMTASHSTA